MDAVKPGTVEPLSSMSLMMHMLIIQIARGGRDLLSFIEQLSMSYVVSRMQAQPQVARVNISRNNYCKIIVGLSVCLLSISPSVSL